MKKIDYILKYFQKKDKLTIGEKDYQKTLSVLFNWLITNDNVSNDKTSKFFPNKTCTAKIIAKQDGVISGLEEIGFLLKKYTNLSIKSLIHDGSQFKKGDTIAQIKGKPHDILGFERTILNILQRMSGIATETNKLINLINYQPPTTNHQLLIAATRKTPWMGLDKKAVAVGGGLTHRLNLSDGILIKDNHLSNISVAQAFKAILNRVKGELIEIEVETEKQAHSAISTFQKLTTNYQLPTTNYHLAILLDNFTPSAAKKLLSDLSNLFYLSKIIFEASGGIDKNNILEWAKTGVDIISLGSLTHSTHATNLSLEF